jgi:hypothetical protein
MNNSYSLKAFRFERRVFGSINFQPVTTYEFWIPDLHIVVCSNGYAYRAKTSPFLSVAEQRLYYRQFHLMDPAKVELLLCDPNVVTVAFPSPLAFKAAQVALLYEEIEQRNHDVRLVQTQIENELGGAKKS